MAVKTCSTIRCPGLGVAGGSVGIGPDAEGTGPAVGAGLCLISRRRGWQLWGGLSWEYTFGRKPGQRLPHISVRMLRDEAGGTPGDGQR